MNKQYQVQVLKRTGFFLTFLSIILVLTAISQQNFLWVLSMVPAVLILCMVPFIAHYTLDSAQLRIKESTKQVVMFSIYNAVITTAVFLILLGLKLEGTLEVGWGYVFVPFWYGMALYLGFISYLIPGMLDRSVNKRSQAAMLGLWFVAITLSSIFHVLYLETDFPTELCIVLSPMLILGFMHLVVFAVPLIQMKMNPRLPKINPIGLELLWIGFITPTVMITLIKMMVADAIPAVVVFLPLLKILIFLIIQQERYYSKVKKEGYQYIEN